MRVAPEVVYDFFNWELSDSPLFEIIPLRIYYEKSGSPPLVPSMIHACSYSRSQALKNYTLLPCVDIVTGREIDKSIYVNINQDTFFFGDKHPSGFTAFNDLLGIVRNSNDPSNFDFEVFKSIKNLALDWDIFKTIIDREPRCLLNIKPEKVTILVRNPTREVNDSRPSYAHRMRGIRRGTCRDNVACGILVLADLFTDCLVELEDPTYKPPYFQVADLSRRSAEENSLEDRQELDGLLEYVVIHSLEQP